MNISEATNKEEEFEKFLAEHQKNFLDILIQYEKKAQLIKDPWTRKDKNGYGLSCIIQDGEFFEKAGVNTTRLTIPLSHGLAQQMRERPDKTEMIQSIDMNNLQNYSLYANGVSLVIHPVNPFVPTVHANFRYLKVYVKETGQLIDEWFGGGCDLTPIYLFEEDAQLYHNQIKRAIIEASPDKGLDLYEKFKVDCDKYFYNKHRSEGRGIGGVFYDDFQLNHSFEGGLRFQRAVAEANLKAYHQILEKRKDIAYNDENLRWKQYRRGRYVEFNLIHDRGTKFGLMTPDARIESILMSLPLIARWEYNFQVKEGSEEAKLVDVLVNPKYWAD